MEFLGFLYVLVGMFGGVTVLCWLSKVLNWVRVLCFFAFVQQFRATAAPTAVMTRMLHTCRAPHAWTVCQFLFKLILCYANVYVIIYHINIYIYDITTLYIYIFYTFKWIQQRELNYFNAVNVGNTVDLIFSLVGPPINPPWNPWPGLEPSLQRRGMSWWLVATCFNWLV